MYGLVNKGLEQMIRAHADDQTWDTIKCRAGVDVELFLSLRQYPDEITYDLVHSASEVLGEPPSECLRAFGHYWMLYTATEGYGELMSLTGATLHDFLQNLPNMHARINLSFPDLQPPVFRCEAVTERSMLLHYHSHRQGLAPMVVGLLEGLSERFGTPITITMIESREQGADHEVFHISFEDNSA